MAAHRRLGAAARRDAGRRAAAEPIGTQDRTWSRWSSDKVDIGRQLGGVLRRLQQEAPPRRPLRALSVGSSSEPQLRLLDATCRGGIHLLDVDRAALDVVAKRCARQHVDGVHLIEADYTRVLADRKAAAGLRRASLEGRRVDLVLFHHSLYYAPRSAWDQIVESTWAELVARDAGAVHAVLMAHRSKDPYSTTALYDTWAGRFFGAHNDQDLAGFGAALRRHRRLTGAQVHTRRTRVVFDHDDFEAFMRVVWMILLHPQVHCFSQDQQDEVTEWVYRTYWSPGVPLVQEQDHLVLLRSG